MFDVFKNTLTFRHGSASALLLIYEFGPCLVTTLYSNDPGKGHAKAVMQEIVDYADERGLSLALSARQFNNERGLNNDQLILFYEKFGFHLIHPRTESNSMVRPRKEN